MLRYGTSKYSRVNTSRADAVSLQVVHMRNCTFDPYTCVPTYLRIPIHASAEKSIAEGDMLSAESVEGMLTWAFSDDIPLLSAAEVCELYMLCVQGGQKKQDVVARGTGKIKTTAAHP